ncbi:nucleotide exchange factor GrpE [Caviibacter abscessus]|uniref:nucleotide exchange factor GrpE n=1 Tax=Caviibacter abscessus TaxID=1766719 RepID=UPI00082C52EB|nr:nucleotide exchange factor GrpE [Caviibacter abscessus]
MDKREVEEKEIEEISNSCEQNQVDETEEKIKALEKEVSDLKAAYSIKLADFQNYTKRKDKEFEEFKKYACESLIIKVIDSLDTLTLAKTSADKAKDFESLSSGIDMIIKNIQIALNDEGVEEINAINEKYDPYIHYAVATENNEEIENEVVTDVLQKGYKLKGKVIRPSMVKINKK